MWLAKRPAPGCSPVTPAQKIMKPASKSRVPSAGQKISESAKKSAERKPAIKHKPVSVTRWWRVAVVVCLFYCLSVTHGFVLLLCVSAKNCFWCWAFESGMSGASPRHGECTFPTSHSELQCHMLLRPLSQQPSWEEWVKWRKRGKSTRYRLRAPTWIILDIPPVLAT